MNRYFSVSEFYKQTFGCKVYKIALDAGCTCPTRDGTKGTRGCIFCSASGSGDFAANRALSVPQQIEEAKKRVQSKNHGGKYLAYFQNFTNTYGDPSRLEKLYTEALASPDVVGLVIATRPDCLSSDILALIAALSRTHFVSIELGLQTSKTETAAFIRRGYETAEYDDAVKRIRAASAAIHVVTHVIFGLPGETERDMLQTVQHCVQVGTDGIKIAVLHVLTGTDLEPLYREETFCCMEMEEYFAVLGKALELLPARTVIHRLTGDGAKKILLAPEWTADKKRVHNAMQRYFDDHDIIQGKLSFLPVRK